MPESQSALERMRAAAETDRRRRSDACEEQTRIDKLDVAVERLRAVCSPSDVVSEERRATLATRIVELHSVLADIGQSQRLDAFQPGTDAESVAIGCLRAGQAGEAAVSQQLAALADLIAADQIGICNVLCDAGWLIRRGRCGICGVPMDNADSDRCHSCRSSEGKLVDVWIALKLHERDGTPLSESVRDAWQVIERQGFKIAEREGRQGDFRADPCEYLIGWLRVEHGKSRADCLAMPTEELARFLNGPVREAIDSSAPKEQDAASEESSVATTPGKKAKRSTQRGEGRARLISELTKHHEYGNGGCLKTEPIGNNELARQSGVAKRTASAFFKDAFKGHRRYVTLCQDPHRLVAALKAVNGEFQPYEFYDARTPDEVDLDDDSR